MFSNANRIPLIYISRINHIFLNLYNIFVVLKKIKSLIKVEKYFGFLINLQVHEVKIYL